MDKNLNPLKIRLIQYIEYKGVSREKFFQSVGLSLANFKGKALESSLSTDSLIKILYLNKDLNAEWLLLEEGKMIKEEIPFDKKTLPFDKFSQVQENKANYLKQEQKQEQIARAIEIHDIGKTLLHDKIAMLEQRIKDREELITEMRYTISMQKEVIASLRDNFSAKNSSTPTTTTQKQ